MAEWVLRILRCRCWLQVHEAPAAACQSFPSMASRNEGTATRVPYHASASLACLEQQNCASNVSPFSRVQLSHCLPVPHEQFANPHLLRSRPFGRSKPGPLPNRGSSGARCALGHHRLWRAGPIIFLPNFPKHSSRTGAVSIHQTETMLHH
jgi:hypothetical protein